MRLDNLVKVSFVKGGARILDVLNAEPARPPCPQAPQQLAGNTEQGRDTEQEQDRVRGGSFPLLPAFHSPPLTASRALLEGSSGEETQAYCVLGPGTGDLSNSAPL